MCPGWVFLCVKLNLKLIQESEAAVVYGAWGVEGDRLPRPADEPADQRGQVRENFDGLGTFFNNFNFKNSKILKLNF